MSRLDPSPRLLQALGLATLVLIFGLGLLASAIPGLQEPPMTEWTATIPREEGARGLEVGGAVLVGGYPRGRILSVNDDAAMRNERGRTLIAIRFALPDSIVLGRNAIIRKSVGVAGTNGALDISDPGSREALFGPDEPRILAIDDSPPAGGSIGILIGRRNGERIEEIANASERLGTELPPRVRLVSALGRSILEESEAFELEAEDDLAGIRSRIEVLASGFEGLRIRARGLQPVFDRLEVTFRELGREISREIDGWKPAIDSIMAGTDLMRNDVDDAVRRLELGKPRLRQAARALASARDDLASIQTRAELLGPEVSDGLARTMARMVLAGGQLSQAIDDLLPLALQAISTHPDRESEHRRALLEAVGDTLQAGTEVRNAARRLETLSSTANAMPLGDPRFDEALSETLEARVTDLEKMLDALDALLRAEVESEIGS